MRELRIGTFTPSLLISVAETCGRLADAGLELIEIPVPSSPAQFTALAHGELDVVMTSPDNVLAYRFLTDNPLGRLLPVEVLAGVDRGLGLSLWIAPDVPSVESVRGRDVAVDVPVSGFAFVAFDLLERAGVRKDDYAVVSLGSTPKRASALTRGRCAATVLNAGNELGAQARGARMVSAVTDLGPYLGTVLAALESPDPDVNDARQRLRHALIATASDVVDGQYADEVRSAAETRLHLGPDEAAAHHACIVEPTTGFVPDGSVDPAAIATLVGLRRRHRPTSELADVEKGWHVILASEPGPSGPGA